MLVLNGDVEIPHDSPCLFQLLQHCLRMPVPTLVISIVYPAGMSVAFFWYAVLVFRVMVDMSGGVMVLLSPWSVLDLAA